MKKTQKLHTPFSKLRARNGVAASLELKWIAHKDSVRSFGAISVLLFCAILAFARASFSQSRGAKAFPAAAAPAEEKPFQESDWVDDRWTKTEIGQFLHATITTPRKTTPQALAIRVGDNNEATICFDTDLLRYAAVWTGGFLKIPDVRYGLMAPSAPSGKIQFSTEPVPGFARGTSFEDPRSLKLGALPRSWGKYKGFYQSGKRTVLSYTIGETPVLESPWFSNLNGLPIFSRVLELPPRSRAVLLRIADVPGEIANRTTQNGIEIASVRDGNSLIVSAAIALTPVKVSVNPFIAGAGALNVHIEPAEIRSRVIILAAKIAPADLGKFAQIVASSGQGSALATDLENFKQGGSVQWPELSTTGTVDQRTDTSFAIDTITMPYENPWNALLFASGHDFFSNGDAAVATAHGNVWRVSGLDDSLKKITWKRFATGLYQPLGLKIIDDQVHVIERDQITILRDINRDGEADFYENFNNDTISAGGSHSYATCLETDSKGDFYFAKCSEGTPFGGTLVRVRRDGSSADVVATGFRYPNGIGIGPGDQLTVADQQGEWVPETRLNLIKPGGFYGYMPSHHRAAAPTAYDPPLCWVPRVLDNSAGGQVWVPAGSWGALSGQMLHLSFGRCTMMLVLRDDSSGSKNGTIPQGAVAALPGRFASGVCRGRFNPHDGHLYLTGLRGWQTSAVRDGCFQRVRYQKDLTVPVRYSTHANEISLTFSEPLNRELAEDTESYSAEQWNYLWSAKYGSADYSPTHPKKQGRDAVKISAARLDADNKTIHLTIDGGLRPVMTFALNYNLESAKGAPLQSALYATINEVR